MRVAAFVFVLTVVSVAGAGGVDSYPEARRGDIVERLHGEPVPDPYRWFESDSPEVDRWVEAQDRLFEGYVNGLAQRDAIAERVAEIGEFASVSTPVVAGGRAFFTRTGAGASRSVLWVKDSEGASRVLLDPEEFFPSADDRMLGFTPSRDGTLVAFGTDNGSGTWGEIRVMEVESGRLLSDRLTGTSGRLGFAGVYWTADGRSFFYFHQDVRARDGDESVSIRNNKIRHHQLGTTQDRDPTIYARPDRPDAFVNSMALTTDDRYLITSLTEKATRRTTHYAIDLTDPDRVPVVLADVEASMSHVHNVGSLQLYRTDLDAPNYRLIGIDAENPAPEQWIELIPEQDGVLSSVSPTRDFLITRVDRVAVPEIGIHDQRGVFLREGARPGIGGLGLNTSPDHNVVHFSFGVLHDPGTIYRLDPQTGESERTFRPELSFDPDEYTIKQVFYSSFDGTRVPMFIAHRKDVTPGPETPLWMYAFGNGGWMAFPWFQRHLVAWMEMGGVYALPGIRGGGEYGSEWQKAGTLHNKTNTIGDYHSAAEWLVENGYTSAGRLVANGGSGSGPLPAIAINQRPELYGAAVIDFPFLDMLRYHKFASGFTRSFGSPDDPEDFAVLRSYSPYHNIREGQCYPPTLITVAENDVSTPPFHCYKHAAALQHSQPCERPVLLQVIWGAGHYSYGTTRAKASENFADQIAFVIRALDLGMRPED